MIDLDYYFDLTSIAAFVFANVYIEMCFVTFNIFFPYISFGSMENRVGSSMNQADR